MTPQDYCYKLAAPVGADFRYSLIGLGPDQREGLSAVRAFCIETAKIVEECHDPGVARTKLDWWQTEVRHLFADNPQHPITRALQPKLADFNLPEEYFREILDGVAMDLEYNSYATFNQLTLYLHRRGSVPALLEAEILGYADRRATARFAHEAGVMLLLLELLHDVRHHVRRGMLYLPEDERRQYGIDASHLLSAQTTEPLRQWFKFQAERIQDYHQRTLSYLPATDRFSQCPLLIRLELATILLEEIAADGYRLIEQRIDLTPLRKLWIAWGLRQREKRNHHLLSVTK